MGLFDIVDNVLGTDLTGKDSAKRAIRAQQGATNQANETMWDMFNQNREDTAAWRDAGKEALGGMQNADFQRDFTMADFTADPGYQFRLQEGQKALERSAAARGGLNSGATMKALMGYGQNFASQEYGNAYNRFNADRDRRFNRLASTAGLGQTTMGQMIGAGQQTAGTVASNHMGMGNAQAGAIIGANNNMNNLIGQGVGAAMAFSDERLKTNIEPVSKEDLAELKAAIKPYRFNYISDEFGKGDWIGVMAQDLEKTKLGRQVVAETPEGHKYLVPHKVMSLFLATMAEEVA